jgi:nucleotide-binding universal stress UspA family protein
MIRRILVPLDGSTVAASILPFVAATARLTGAAVTLLRVLPATAADLDERLAREDLATAAARLADHGLTAAAQVARGQPAEQIARFGHDHDVIAMATHGRSGVGRLVRGSVADAVLRATRVPVLLVRSAEGPVHVPGPPRRIVVPLDGSALAEQALPMAADLARRSGATIRLVTSVHWASQVFGADPGLLDADALDQTALADPHAQEYVAATAHEAARDYLEQLQGQLRRDGLTVDTAIRFDEPASAILGQATDAASDLIVMTTHGRSGLHRWLLGSVAEHVLRAATGPVLVVRATAPVGSGYPSAGVTRRAGRARSRRRAPLRVKEIMTRPVITVRDDDTCMPRCRYRRACRDPTGDHGPGR